MSQTKHDYSWADSLDYMEGIDIDLVSLQRPKIVKADAPRDQVVWGVLVTAAITMAAIWLGDLDFWPFTVRIAGKATHPVESVMIAIILGMIVGNVLALPKIFHSGIKFSVKKLLPLSIVLLGVRLNFGDMMKLGMTGLVLSCLTTVVSLVLLLALAKWMKLPQKLGILLGVGTAICGGSAIVATAPVIEAEEKDVAFSLATVTVLGLLGMFVMPVVGHFLDLSSRQFGIWAAMAIHQIPQVLAAGYSYWPTNTDYSPEAGDTATIAKLARVCLLAPMVFILGFLHTRSKSRSEAFTGRKVNYAALFPTFVLGFIGMALLKTLGLIPEISVHDSVLLGPGEHTLKLGAAAEQVSKFCVGLCMAGVGLETKLSAMRKTGLKPFVASLLAVGVVAVLVLALIKAFKV